MCCLTLCYPMGCTPPGSSGHGISQAGVLEWVAIFFSRGSSWPRDQTWISCLAGGFFPNGFFPRWRYQASPWACHLWLHLAKWLAFFFLIYNVSIFRCFLGWVEAHLFSCLKGINLDLGNSPQPPTPFLTCCLVLTAPSPPLGLHWVWNYWIQLLWRIILLLSARMRDGWGPCVWSWEGTVLL